MCNFTVPVQVTLRQRFLNCIMVLKEQVQLRKIRRGEIASFEELFHRFYRGLRGYAETIVRKGEVAEEVVQDVFYNIWKNREVLQINTSWQSYLYRAVHNNAVMYLRKTKREQLFDQEWNHESESDSADPAALLQRKELSDLLSKTLESLPERTREIFRLNRQEGMKYREIAEKLSISVKAVEANMGRALKTLRKSLEKYEQE